MIGFAIHNTTEGLAIVAPLRGTDGEAAARPALGRLLGLGLIAGAPAMLGAWIGAAAFNTERRGAALRRRRRRDRPGDRPAGADDARPRGPLLNPIAVAGILVGIAVMYATGLLVSV